MLVLWDDLELVKEGARDYELVSDLGDDQAATTCLAPPMRIATRSAPLVAVLLCAARLLLRRVWPAHDALMKRCSQIGP
ncbi:hypothetical protein E2562_021837 [Oryza meyeriana var. granulata]|uniref:Uncharacterized protein n=1 Tax=Oryza meyeriana var. granulata TaxID=110450 RepID=A0A6G1ENC9_9ORYZ|nr:hypothetical protein E2562_021837 [Oryza meyeriana var. granulata]